MAGGEKLQKNIFEQIIFGGFCLNGRSAGKPIDSVTKCRST